MREIVSMYQASKMIRQVQMSLYFRANEGQIGIQIIPIKCDVEATRFYAWGDWTLNDLSWGVSQADLVAMKRMDVTGLNMEHRDQLHHNMDY